MKLTIHEVTRVVGAKNDVTSYADSPLVKAEFDSRLIGPGDLFVPLKGARDGHDFIETAFENGAAVTLSEKAVAGHPYILVEDVFDSLSSSCSLLPSKNRSRCLCCYRFKWEDNNQGYVGSFTFYKLQNLQNARKLQ